MQNFPKLVISTTITRRYAEYCLANKGLVEKIDPRVLIACVFRAALGFLFLFII